MNFWFFILFEQLVSSVLSIKDDKHISKQYKFSSCIIFNIKHHLNYIFFLVWSDILFRFSHFFISKSQRKHDLIYITFFRNNRDKQLFINRDLILAVFNLKKFEMAKVLSTLSVPHLSLDILSSYLILFFTMSFFTSR